MTRIRDPHRYARAIERRKQPRAFTPHTFGTWEARLGKACDCADANDLVEEAIRLEGLPPAETEKSAELRRQVAQALKVVGFGGLWRGPHAVAGPLSDLLAQRKLAGLVAWLHVDTRQEL